MFDVVLNLFLCLFASHAFAISPAARTGCVPEPTISACNVSTSGGEGGFYCGPKKLKCVDQRRFCSAKYFRDSCPENFAHAKLDNCLQYHIVKSWSWAPKKQFSYYVAKAEMSWRLASDYCSGVGRNFHLVTFDNEQELLFVANEFRKVIRNPSNLTVKSLFDPQGLSCIDPSRVKTESDAFWLGVEYDGNEKKWMADDRKAFATNLPAFATDPSTGKLKAAKIKRKFSHVFQKLQAGCNNTSCASSEDRIRFSLSFGYVHVKLGNSIELSDDNNMAYVICKKRRSSTPKFNRRANSRKSNDANCLSGFTCPDGKCIVGFGFKDSQLCDGLQDCDDGSDEQLKNCPHVNHTSSTMLATYIGVEHNWKLAQRFCSSQGWKFTSMHTQADVEFISKLPNLFETTMKVAKPWALRYDQYAEQDFVIALQRDPEAEVDAEWVDAMPNSKHSGKGVTKQLYIRKGKLYQGPIDDDMVFPFVCRTGDVTPEIESSTLSRTSHLRTLLFALSVVLIIFWCH